MAKNDKKKAPHKPSELEPEEARRRWALAADVRDELREIADDINDLEDERAGHAAKVRQLDKAIEEKTGHKDSLSRELLEVLDGKTDRLPFNAPFPPAKPSTAAGDKPGEASRGAAVDRARAELGDAIDTALELGGVLQFASDQDHERAAFAVLDRAAGGFDVGTDHKKLLAGATLELLGTWRGLVEKLSKEAAKGAVDAWMPKVAYQGAKDLPANEFRPQTLGQFMAVVRGISERPVDAASAHWKQAWSEHKRPSEARDAAIKMNVGFADSPASKKAAAKKKAAKKSAKKK